MASSGDSGLEGLSEELPFLTMKFPFLLRKIPSILSRYCLLLNPKVNSRLSSCAGVAEGIPPDPLNEMVLLLAKSALSWNPEIMELTSTLGLKSTKSARYTRPKEGELKYGISEVGTPVRRYESTVQKSPAECSK